MLLSGGYQLSAHTRNYPWEKTAALSRFMCPFQKQFTSNNWFIWKHRPKLLILTWDNSEGPAYLQSSLWDQVKVLLRLNCRPFSPSVNMPSSFLSHVLSQERSLMNFLHANLHFSIFFLRNTIFNSHAQSGVV